MSCVEDQNGNNCPEQKDNSCKEFQLTKSNDSCFIDSVVNESLNIAGADLHVFKLLGVHEQGRLVDLTENGRGISGGDLPGFSSNNTFDTFVSEWRSLQKGSGVTSSAYIGYDFGELKLDNGRLRYGVETSIKHNIATLKIKQSSNPNKRVTKARVERSADGTNWFGVSVVEFPDNDQLNTVYFKHSVPSRYWRIRPITFNGGATDFWSVQALQLMDYDATSIDDIQDNIFQENRDRDYAEESITLKGSYDLVDIQTELTRFGIELPSQSYYLQVSFSSCVQRLGRPLIIGDIIELPSETQYSPTMEPIKKFMEVTDVGWSTEGYTPGWQPTLLRVIIQPMFATQETQDIFGGFAANIDSSGLFDKNDGNHPIFQDISNINQTIGADANTIVPERGREANNDIHEFTEEQIQAATDQGIPNIQSLGLRSKALYAEDGLPPNGLPYTEGDALPDNPKDGVYHRLTYSGLASDVPPRLFRYSLSKGRWVYLETDKRRKYNNTKPVLQEFLSHPNAIPPSEIE